STRIRTVSRAVSRVLRPLKLRTSSPLWNSSVAPIPSSRSASLAAVRWRVPLSKRRDVNSATPCDSPSAATPAGMLPRNATNGFDGREADTRTAPFPNTVRSGRFIRRPLAHGSERRTDARRRGKSSRPRAPARRGPSRPCRGAAPRSPRTTGPRREGEEAAPAPEDGRKEDQSRGVSMGRGGNVPSDREEVGRPGTDEVAPALAPLVRLREPQRIRRSFRPQQGEGLSHMLHRDRRIEPADQDQGRVVRRVVSEIVAVERLTIEGREGLLVSDRRPM